MKLLDALIPDPARTVGRGMEQRSSFQGWVNDVLALGPAAAGLVTTTYGRTPAEPIGDNFAGYVIGALRANPIVWTVELIRVAVFAEARFLWQEFNKGRPGRLYGDRSLQLLETPWAAGTTGDLLARMLLHADFAGNAFTARVGDELIQLRPDWTDILLTPRTAPLGAGGADRVIGWRQAGLAYYDGGKGQTSEPAIFLPGEYSHFAPMPDPLASYRGMSWLTPVVREVQADGAATRHKLKFFENGATPNLAVSLPKEIGPEAFAAFRAKMDAEHKGVDNAYRTLYVGGGADVTVVGADFKQIDLSASQGKGETRIANAAGVPAVIAGLSEGMQGSSLNAGNYQSAKRRFADGTMRPLWRNAAGSLQAILKPPSDGSRLWYDDRDVAFLRDDEADRAQIQSTQAVTIRQLTDAGFLPESVIAAVEAEDLALLKHSGYFSVQLQAPGASGTTDTPTTPADPADDEPGEG